MLTVEYIYLTCWISRTSHSSRRQHWYNCIKLRPKTPSPRLSKILSKRHALSKNFTMPGPKAYIELASKPLHPEVEALNDRRLKSVARWHAFAVREEARMWAEDANTAHQRPLEQQEALTVQGEETVNTKVCNVTRFLLDSHQTDVSLLVVR